MTPGPGPGKRALRVLAWTLLGVLGAGLALTAWIKRSVDTFYRDMARSNAPRSLKTIASAQEDLRVNDRDANGAPDYWRADIAGLYALVPKGGQEPVKLIEISVAGADDRPLTDLSAYVVREPKAGYWFRALRFADETSPAPDRFAAHAFPAEPAGKLMYVVRDDKQLWSKPAVAGGVDVFPADPAAEGWEKTP